MDCAGGLAANLVCDLLLDCVDLRQTPQFFQSFFGLLQRFVVGDALPFLLRQRFILRAGIANRRFRFFGNFANGSYALLNRSYFFALPAARKKGNCQKKR